MFPGLLLFLTRFMFVGLTAVAGLVRGLTLVWRFFGIAFVRLFVGVSLVRLFVGVRRLFIGIVGLMLAGFAGIVGGFQLPRRLVFARLVLARVIVLAFVRRFVAFVLLAFVFALAFPLFVRALVLTGVRVFVAALVRGLGLFGRLGAAFVRALGSLFALLRRFGGG
jgi:hypothetical protein